MNRLNSRFSFDNRVLDLTRFIESRVGSFVLSVSSNIINVGIGFFTNTPGDTLNFLQQSF